MPLWLVEPSNEHNKSEEAFRIWKCSRLSHSSWFQRLSSASEKSGSEAFSLNMSEQMGKLSKILNLFLQKQGSWNTGRVRTGPRVILIFCLSILAHSMFSQKARVLHAKSWHPHRQGRRPPSGGISGRLGKQASSDMFFLQLNWNPHALPWGLFSLKIQIASC